MKTVIAIRGVSCSGKSSTIRHALTLLLAKYPEAKVQSLTRPVGWKTKDIHVIVTIGIFTVGIESQGDPSSSPSRLEKSLQEFVAKNCDVILCATRTAGRTVEIIEALGYRGYEIAWRDRVHETDPRAYDIVNHDEAAKIVAQIEALIIAKSTPLSATG